ncbi:unnamed protein product [Penicillium olsonii]|uniref:Mitochondrial mRNA processing protein PET127 n=1 Tax=Penicillium olsonii TaxID=99116 RepID=A0A9W4MR82_PENOL|nr:unnamed protein product [Penicillium olsonii]CAG8085699.1 unnamed protein product [Penicillium olsonii]CAG8176062.1 unnamed protein product [Penicillium olsonii]
MYKQPQKALPDTTLNENPNGDHLHRLEHSKDMSLALRNWKRTRRNMELHLNDLSRAKKEWKSNPEDRTKAAQYLKACTDRYMMQIKRLKHHARCAEIAREFFDALDQSLRSNDQKSWSKVKDYATRLELDVQQAKKNTTLFRTEMDIMKAKVQATQPIEDTREEQTQERTLAPQPEGSSTTSAKNEPKESAENSPDFDPNIAAQILENSSTNTAKRRAKKRRDRSLGSKEDTVAPKLESSSTESAKSEPKGPVEASPDSDQSVAVHVLGSASTEPANRRAKEPSDRALDSQQDAVVAESESSSTESAEAKANEPIKLTLDPSQNIVEQILKNCSQNSPQPPQAGPGSVPEDAGRESLKHVAKFVEAKHEGTLSLPESKLVALDAPLPPVPGVSFGLDRVLFNPGVYHLRDPRSRVYNFDPYLGEIMPVSEFDYTTLKPYITSSKDVLALQMAEKHKKKYYGSSSSMTSVLAHFHYLLSSWRPINVRQISMGFPDEMRAFTRILRAPTAMFLRYKEKEDSYAIDADKEYDSANILTNLGKSMEKLLTLPKEDFERYRRSNPNKITPEEESAVPESYHYTAAGKFMMRSQLDAYDPRLPGTGMYDLKTRAVTSIRMDVTNHENGVGYEIRNLYGNFESYEREYFDMMRAAFLKYSLQVRIGRMDGIFVAYHNIARIFGFQYISLPEMDLSLHGQTDTTLGDREFEFSLGLWEEIMDRATAKFPKQSLRFHFETRQGSRPFMYIFAEPVTDKQIHDIQTRNQAQIDAFNERLFNPDQSRSQVMDLGAAPPAEDTPDVEEASAAGDDKPNDPLMAMTLLIQNRVNDQVVPCPENITRFDKWEVSYELNELAEDQGRTLLHLLKKRRRDTWNRVEEAEGDSSPDRSAFLRMLQKYVRKGRSFREREELKDSREGIVWYEDSKKSA